MAVLNRPHPAYSICMWGVFMFCVLHIESSNSKGPKWLRRFHKPLPPICEQIPIRGGAFFYDVTLFRDWRGEADLSVLPQLVGGSAQRILLCGEEELSLPAPLRLFKPSLFLPTVFFQSARAFLETEDTPPSERVLGVCDPDARVQAALYPFANLAKTVKVYTRRAQSYASIRAELLSESGLSLIVSEQQGTLADCTVILDPFAQIAGHPMGTLTLRKCGRVVLAGEGVKLPAEYAERCPKGANPLLFAAALYELCNVRELQSLRYTRFVPINPTSVY